MQHSTPRDQYPRSFRLPTLRLTGTTMMWIGLTIGFLLVFGTLGVGIASAMSG